MNIKRRSIFLALLFLVSLASNINAQQLQLPQASPRAGVEQRIGLTDVKVTYYRPLMKGRKIFGELVPYNQVWRTGANNATVFTISDNAKIGNQTLPAGTYSLHTIPTPNDWTIIFNKVADQWGSFEYDQKQDALRVSVKPVATSAPLEIMTIAFTNVSDNKATMEIAWADVRVPVAIEVDTTTKALTMARDAVAKAKPDDWRTPLQAAGYAYQNNVAADEARTWLNRSLAVNENYGNLSLQARMLAREGKKAEAITTAEKAIRTGKAAKPRPADTSAMEKFLTDMRAGNSSAMNGV